MGEDSMLRLAGLMYTSTLHSKHDPVQKSGSTSKESFSATVTIKAYIKLPWFDILIDGVMFDNAALEFGGEYMCDQP